MKVFAFLERFWKAKLEFLSIGRVEKFEEGSVQLMHSCGHLFHKLIPLIWIRTSYQNFKLTEEHDSCICWVFVCKTYLLLQDFLTKIFPFLEKYDTKNISIGNPNIILQESATCAYLFRRRHDITCCLPGSVGLPTQGTLLWVIVALGRKVISFFLPENTTSRESFLFKLN